MLALFDFAVVMPTLTYRLLLVLGVALSVGAMSWPLLERSGESTDAPAAATQTPDDKERAV